MSGRVDRNVEPTKFRGKATPVGSKGQGKPVHEHDHESYTMENQVPRVQIHANPATPR